MIEVTVFPNFLSSDNTFVDELRQKPLAKKKIENWIGLEPEDFCTEEMLRNYQRNKTLIDLECIPDVLKEKDSEQNTSKYQKVKIKTTKLFYK